VSLKVFCMFTLPVNTVGEEPVADLKPRLANLMRLRLTQVHVDKSRSFHCVFVLCMNMHVRFPEISAITASSMSGRQWSQEGTNTSPLRYLVSSSTYTTPAQSHSINTCYLSSSTYLLSTTCDSIFSISPSNLTFTCPPSCFARQLWLTSPL
jgi:hypothetical protein